MGIFTWDLEGLESDTLVPVAAYLTIHIYYITSQSLLPSCSALLPSMNYFILESSEVRYSPLEFYLLGFRKN